MQKKPLVWGHRGASAYAPENTLPAFALAADQGADGVELDVYLTRDGYPVINHDVRIERTSNGQGKITEYTLRELRVFDFGFRANFGDAFKGTRIPTLDEVYELLGPRGLTVNVEIKDPDPAVTGVILACARRHAMEERVIYSSFNHAHLEEILRQCPTAMVAPLYNFNMTRAWDYAKLIPACAVHPHLGQLVRIPDYVEKCHAQGLRVHPWTVNEEADLRMCRDKDVDAVITNYPDLARRVMDEQ